MAREKRYRFADPRRQRGFTAIPNVLLLDTDVSAGAKVLYGVLSHLAFTGDEPTQKELAPLVGVAAKALRGYAVELAGRGLLEMRRRGNGKTMDYVIYDAAAPANVASEEDRSVEMTEQQIGRNDRPRSVEMTDPSRTRDPYSNQDQRRLEKAAPSPSENAPYPPPPKLVMVNGKNLAFDALQRATRSGPGMEGAIAFALVGKPKAHPPEFGIRSYFAAELPPPDPASFPAEADWWQAQEQWEASLAMEIERRALIYIDVMPPGATLTPTALRKWWGTIVLRQEGRLSDDDFDTLVERLDDDDFRRRL